MINTCWLTSGQNCLYLRIQKANFIFKKVNFVSQEEFCIECQQKVSTAFSSRISLYR